MRRKLTLWSLVALVTATCVQTMTIDNDIRTHNGVIKLKDIIKSKSQQKKNFNITRSSRDLTETTKIQYNNKSDEHHFLTNESVTFETGLVDDKHPNNNDENTRVKRSVAFNSRTGAVINEDTSLEDNSDNNSTEVCQGNGSGDTEEECGEGESDEGSGDGGLDGDGSGDELIKGEIVITDNGPVQGYILHKSGIYSYIDIPYGAFRGPFLAPTQPDNWEAVRSVKEHNKRCPQIEYPDTYVGELDCLTLSVFTPPNAVNLSVLFHIHDGHFTAGSADPAIYGPEYIVSKEVILVLPNYRLGALGFLCLQNETVPGNAALKDLTLALNWTRNNIAAFGGDPSNIAISGDGTAGALVGYLALSSTSRDYITKAITDSGSVLSHWALDRNPIGSATSLAELIRENSVIRSDNVFQDIDVQTLITAAKYMEFKPCVEVGSGSFITTTPWKMLQNGGINITFMIGSASYAGLHEAFKHNETTLTQLDDDFKQILPNDLTFDNGDNQKTETANKLRVQYFGDDKLSSDGLANLSLLYTDAMYLGPGIRTARSLVEAGATVYLYEFAFVGKFNRELESMGTPIKGATRGDMIGYIFNQDGEIYIAEDTDEQRMVDSMTDLWVSFVQTGKPKAQYICWNELKKSEDTEEEWLLLDAEVAQKKGVHVDRLALWTQIYNDHYIERNLAFRTGSRIYSLFIAISLLRFSTITANI